MRAEKGVAPAPLPLGDQPDVGGSVAVSSVLAGAPVYTAEAVRYGVACLILVALARLAGRRLVMPRTTEWLWLAGVTVTGLVMFNVALVEGARHAEPAVLGVAVACVPAVLALIGPLLEGTRPRAAAVAAALTVTCGAGLVQGLGRTDAVGAAWAAVVFVCEAAFTLLAIPVLRRHGPWGVSVHTTWLATAMFAALGAAHEGPAAITKTTRPDGLPRRPHRRHRPVRSRRQGPPGRRPGRRVPRDPGVAARLRADGPEADSVPLRRRVVAAPLPQGGQPAPAAPAGRPVQRRLAGLRRPGRGPRRGPNRLAARAQRPRRRRGPPHVRPPHPT